MSRVEFFCILFTIKHLKRFQLRGLLAARESSCRPPIRGAGVLYFTLHLEDERKTQLT